MTSPSMRRPCTTLGPSGTFNDTMLLGGHPSSSSDPNWTDRPRMYIAYNALFLYSMQRLAQGFLPDATCFRRPPTPGPTHAFPDAIRPVTDTRKGYECGRAGAGQTTHCNQTKASLGAKWTIFFGKSLEPPVRQKRNGVENKAETLGRPPYLHIHGRGNCGRTNEISLEASGLIIMEVFILSHLASFKPYHHLQEPVHPPTQEGCVRIPPE